MKFALWGAVILIIINSVQIGLLIYTNIVSRDNIADYESGYIAQKCEIINYTRVSITDDFNGLLVNTRIIQDYELYRFNGDPDFSRIDKYIIDHPIGSFVSCKYHPAQELNDTLIFKDPDLVLLVIDDEDFNKINILFYVLVLLSSVSILTVFGQLLTWRTIKSEYSVGLLSQE